MKKLSLLAAALCALVSFDLRAEVVEIATPEDFVTQITANPAGDFKLTANIDLTGVAYERPACFSGSLDGQGHTISGLATQFCLTNAGTLAAVTFDGTTDGTNRKFSGADVGAISCFAKDASYTDVIVKGYTLSTGASRSGFFSANAVGAMRFTRCATDESCITVEGSGNNCNSAGFIGALTGVTTDDAIFTCCTNNATMHKKGDYNSSQCTAGFVASVSGGNLKAAGYPALRLIKCVNRGQIIAKGANGNLSGFVGMTAAAAGVGFNTGTLRIVFADCVNEGDVSSGDYGVSTSAGFIVQLGHGISFAITNCINRGAIGGSSVGKSSGFVGSMGYICSLADVKSVFVNSANYGAVFGKVAAGLFAEGGTASGARNPEVPGFYNCANYGMITGSTAFGEFSAKKPAYYALALDNCYSETDRYVGDEGTGTFTATAMHGPYEADYDAAAACEALSARAELKGWDKWWKVGKVSGKPELLQWSGDVIAICKVRYFDWDGTLLKERDVEKGASDFPPGTPARSGHVFTGWDKSTECVMEDMDVTAQYRERVTGEIGCPADFISDLTTNPAGEYFLANDIDFAESGYASIAAFAGSLDGAGHVISGVGTQPLFTSLSGTIRNVRLDGGEAELLATKMGLFCVEARGARFEDVVVGNATIKVNASNKSEGIGLFAGFAYDGTTFLRCSTLSDAMVSGNDMANANVGGFVGVVMNDALLAGVVASFTDCTNNAVTVANSANNNGQQGHGGFVGKCYLKSSAETDRPTVFFDRCANLSDIEVKVNNLPVGGLVGRYVTADMKGETLAFTNCLNAGSVCSTVTGASLNGGGLVGIVKDDSVIYMTGCVNRGKINMDGGNAGGLVGNITGFTGDYTSAFVLDCANYGTITGGGSGGLFGTVLGNSWRNCGVVIKNCANYGSADSEMLGACVGIKNKTSIDNVFGLTANIWQSLSDSCTTPIVQNAVSAADEGYTPSAAKRALNAVADESGYGEWIVGKVGGKKYPELAAFCKDPASSGLILLFR